MNFDSLNPANTLWTKQYNVWAAPEKEKDRYLQFEKWWGAFVRIRGEELDYIVDNLFVGNKLSTAQIVTRDGIRLDMRNIKSPILCFCSKGDNITPPQQALDWILDNYDSVDEIRKHGQTILYCLHETAGHLAIFVGTKVAAKEHSEFINYMDLIDGLPPGLYEIVITDKSKGEAGAELLEGDYNVRIEERGLEDIRALGGNSIEDEREFEAVARLSEISKALYATFVQPWIKPWVTSQVVAAMQRMQPLRLGYALFSDKNPLMRGVAPLAEKARAERKPADPDNPFLKIQEQVSDMMTASLQALGSLCGKTAEAIFHAVYGSPWVQGWLGVTPQRRQTSAKAGHLARSRGGTGCEGRGTPHDHGRGRPPRSHGAGRALHRCGATRHRRPHLRSPASHPEGAPGDHPGSLQGGRPRAVGQVGHRRESGFAGTAATSASGGRGTPCFV